MREKIKIHFTDQNVFPYNINLTMAFLNWPIKTLINQNLNWLWQSKFKLSFDAACVQLYVTQPCLHTLMQTRLSANQSARTILVIL